MMLRPPPAFEPFPPRDAWCRGRAEIEMTWHQKRVRVELGMAKVARERFVLVALFPDERGELEPWCVLSWRGEPRFWKQPPPEHKLRRLAYDPWLRRDGQWGRVFRVSPLPPRTPCFASLTETGWGQWLDENLCAVRGDWRESDEPLLSREKLGARFANRSSNLFLSWQMTPMSDDERIRFNQKRHAQARREEWLAKTAWLRALWPRFK